MLKVLLKKQFAEAFRSYFYDAKKNRMRSRGTVIAWFVFFVILMAGMLGGMFTMLSLSLCEALNAAGVGWLYFLLLGGLAIVLGAFGSVFNTYSSLYLAKDNDLLLSMPIPVRTIMTARLMSVYLMGSLYASVVLLPMLIVYWIVCKATAANVICGILFFVIISFIILLLSCLLGWVVARVSVKLKNRSFVTVLIALVFIGLYYFFYFKASDLIRDIVANAGVYGAKIKGAAYALYLFGRIGEGDWLATVVWFAVTLVLFLLIWAVMQRSFLRIATSAGNVKKVRYAEKTAKEKSAFSALVRKEFGRFTSSANYMLNCGLAVLLIPVIGVMILLKGKEVFQMLDMLLPGRPGTTAVLACTALIMICSMNDMAAPAVSLEGKNIWITQSLPVSPGLVLRAKAAVQLLLTGIPMIFASFAAALMIDASVTVRLLVFLVPLLFTVFSAVFNTTIGLKMPNLNWTNEITPIKQSAPVMIAIFGVWILAVAFAGGYLLIGYKLGAAVYLIIWALIFAGGSYLLLKWLDTKGGKIFASL